jgi:hypothetical protein
VRLAFGAGPQHRCPLVSSFWSWVGRHPSRDANNTLVPYKPYFPNGESQAPALRVRYGDGVV